MDVDERRGLFRGSELPRFLALLAIALVGWVVVWKLAPFRAAPAPPQERVAGTPPPIVPDAGPAFESVTDRTAIGFRDTAAYEILLERARETAPAALAAQARRDVALVHLYERPAHYRGVPIQVLGRCQSVIRYESKYSRTGWLYQACVSTYDDMTFDSQKFPYVCVFEEPPKGFPIGGNVSERILFNGYFLKLWLYPSKDIHPFAPLLVGRIGWTPPEQPTDDGGRSLRFWAAVLVGIVFAFTLYRWLAGLKRSLTPRPARSWLLDRPTDDIAPEALAEWVDTVSDDAQRLRDLADDGEDDPDATEPAH
jgi:hypothetical protein